MNTQLALDVQAIQQQISALSANQDYDIEDRADAMNDIAEHANGLTDDLLPESDDDDLLEDDVIVDDWWEDDDDYEYFDDN